jgi:TetR/AcrR family fatty acid metabolism transcriptional regulator
LTLWNARGTSRAVSNESPFSPPATRARPARKGDSTKGDRARKKADASSEKAADKAQEKAQEKAQDKQDKRERILRAAVKVFARKGFYATRVSEIAKAAGVADGTIYLYFENKDDVLISLFEDRITRLIGVLEGEMAKIEGFEPRFRRIVELQLGLLDGQRDLAEVVTVNLRQSTRLLKLHATPLFTKYLDVLARVVAEGQREGVVRADVSPRIAARSLWGALDALALTWAIGGGEVGHLSRAAKQVGDVFLSGLTGPTASGSHGESAARDDEH